MNSNQRRPGGIHSSQQMQGKTAALDIMNVCGQRTLIMWAGTRMKWRKLLPAGVVFLPGDSRQEGRDAGHQHIHSRKCPAVLMSRPFVPINGTFINFVGRYMLQGLPLDLQGIKPNTQTRPANDIQARGKDKVKQKSRTWTRESYN